MAARRPWRYAGAGLPGAAGIGTNQVGLPEAARSSQQDHPSSFSAKVSGWTAKANVHRKRLQKILLRRKPLDQVMRDRTCGCLAR